MNLKKFFLLSLFVISFLLRIWQGPGLFFWHVDEEIIALTVKRIVIEHHPQLIGFPIPGGIHLGPLMYYVFAFFYFLVFLDPLKLPLVSALLGALAVFLVYRIGRTIFGDEEIGIYAAVLYAFSYLVNIYSRLFTALTFAPILSLLTYYLIYKIWATKKQKYIYSLGLVLLFAIQNEGSSLSLIALSILGILIFKIRLKLKTFLVLAGTFLLFH